MTCLVVGAGSVGARKAGGLLESGARVRLVAPQVGKAAEYLLINEQVELINQPYQPWHLDSITLAFAATDNKTVNAQIVADALSRNIPVNSADSQEHRNGEFIVPATMRRGSLCIAVSTGGASPKLARRIRSDLEAVYGVEYEGYVELLGDMRSYIKECVDDPTLRSAAFESLIEIESGGRAARNLLRDSGSPDANDELRENVIEARRIVEAALHRGLE